VKRALAGLLVIVAGAGVVFGSMAREDRRRGEMNFASPAEIVGAEVAFQQLAQRKGQWTAFRETAAPDAVLFVPQPVLARDWLKRQANPAQTVAWQPHQVWLSCDGSLAVTYGAWQRPDRSVGWFTTVWQRQKKGDYKWVMDQGDTLSAPLEAPEMIGASVAMCERRGHGGVSPQSPAPQSAVPAPPPAPPPPGTRSGVSVDRTLSWSIAVAPDCSRTLKVTLSRGASKTETVLEKRAAAPSPPASCPAA